MTRRHSCNDKKPSNKRKPRALQHEKAMREFHAKERRRLEADAMRHRPKMWLRWADLGAEDDRCAP